MAKIGFIGIGHMGKPISQRLVNAGHEVAVFDKEISKGEEVEGAIIAENPAQVAEDREYLFTMLPYSDDTIDVIAGDDGALSAARPNCVFIDIGTGSPSLSWFLGRQVKEEGFEYLDCPVSGSVEPAKEGKLLLMGSGNSEVFDNCLEIFEAFADKIHFMGEENGLGQLMKLTLNTMLGAGMVMFCESINFGLKAGLDKDLMLEVMNDSPLLAPFMKVKTDKILTEKFDADFQTYLMDKDFMYINEVAEHVKAALPLNSTAMQLYRTAMSEGKDKQDYSSIFEILKYLAFGSEEMRKAA